MADNKIFGYVRVSTKGQNADRQISTMKSKGIDERDIYVDKSTGKNFDRPSYQLLTNQLLREGDLLYIDALDRLGRNYDEVIREWKRITRTIKADIVVIEQKHIFDSQNFKEMGDIGKLMEDQFLSLLSFVADQELKKIKERQRQGIEKALEKGTKFGRPTLEFPGNWIFYYEKWRSNEITAKVCMEQLELKRTSFYKLVKRYEESEVA